jgi:hypothetical protein
MLQIAVGVCVTVGVEVGVNVDVEEGAYLWISGLLMQCDGVDGP